MSEVRSNIAQQGFSRRGPGMGAPTEKPKNGQQTLRRLAGYFRPERRYVIYLATAVVLAVAASVVAPRLQSSVIDELVARRFGAILPLLGWMLGIYILHGCATLLQGFLTFCLICKIFIAEVGRQQLICSRIPGFKVTAVENTANNIASYTQETIAGRGFASRSLRSAVNSGTS